MKPITGLAPGMRSCAALALLAAIAAPLAAASPAGIAFQRIDISGLPEIVVYFTASDAQGASVLGLASGDLEVTIDRRPQRVAALDSALAGGESLAAALLFDRSGSMESALEETKRAARDFLERLNVGDLAAIVSFDDAVTVAAAFSPVGDAARRAIESLEPGRDTALYDALALAVEMLAPVATNRKAIIVLSDGKDTRSLLDRDTAVELAATAGVPVFAVALAEEVDDETLSSLATRTGGAFFRAARSRDLMEIYRRIGERLENQYRAVIEASIETDEAWHELRFAISDPREGELAASRDFVASVGVGVSRGTMRGFERATRHRRLGRALALGSLAGLLLGAALLAAARLVLGAGALRPLRSLGLLVSATGLGALLGVLGALIQ